MWTDSVPSRRRSVRRVRVLLAGGVAALMAALFLVIVVRAADDPSARRVTMLRRTAASALSGVPEQAGGSADGDGAGELLVPPAVPRPALHADAGARAVEARLARLDPTIVRYTFDAGPGRAIVDSAGTHPLRQVVVGGGSVALARRGEGYALQFPRRCGLAPSRCPRAILESTQADAFNAGTRPIRFGAAVLMAPTDTGPGANVLQKGFSVGGGTQFKLQVDGRAGRPSCVLANRNAIYRLMAPVSVADGHWHSIACARVDGRLSIDVDGFAVSRAVPAGLSIRNNEPLRIGGKGTAPGNDQYAGWIDEVFVALY